jgi:hypothetical protein
MRNWALTFPLLNYPLPETRPVPANYEDWSVAELYAGERFAPSAQTASPAPNSPAGVGAEPATAASLPDWLADAHWQATPGRLPELSPTVELDPFERAAIRTRRSVIPDSRRRRSPMGPPFLDEPPQDYPSHLGPVPRGPDWEQVVPGPTPWSALAPPPRATDWGRVLTGIECRRTEDGGHHECINPGGRRFTVPTNEAFPDYIGPGQPNYHSYNITAPGRRRNEMPGIIAGPTPGPFWSVTPATAEGTPNPAAPAYVQFLQRWANRRIPGLERQLGAASWPVMSIQSLIRMAARR